MGRRHEPPHQGLTDEEVLEKLGYSREEQQRMREGLLTPGKGIPIGRVTNIVVADPPYGESPLKPLMLDFLRRMAKEDLPIITAHAVPPAPVTAPFPHIYSTYVPTTIIGIARDPKHESLTEAQLNVIKTRVQGKKLDQPVTHVTDPSKPAEERHSLDLSEIYPHVEGETMSLEFEVDVPVSEIHLPRPWTEFWRIHFDGDGLWTDHRYDPCEKGKTIRVPVIAKPTPGRKYRVEWK